MKNAAETVYQPEDEEGVADGAASLGPDGGPLVARRSGVEGGQEDLDDIADDDAWLEEELSEEELAALGEEDFDLENFSDEDFDDIDLDDAEFDDETMEGEYAVEDFSETDDYSENDGDVAVAVEEDYDIENIDISETDYSDDAAEFEASLNDDSFEQAPAAAETVVDPEHSALVAAGAGIMDAGLTGDEVSDIDDGQPDHRPVPRISIHAFCETPQTTSLLEQASVDRRLAKAHLTIHMGGVNKAIDQFQTASTPNLIILETLVGGTEIFAKLGELAEVCDPSTKVVIIGQVNDIVLYRELIRQGISEYIVRPHSPLQIIKTIAELYVDPAAPPIGRTVAFVGARGGVGSSTIAHNIGWCVAEELKSDTVILDLDLPFGTASLDFDQEASAGLVEALTSPERLDDVLLDRLLQKHTDHLSLFTAPSVLDREYEMDDQAFETVLDVVRGAAPTIIVDIPHVWTSWSKRILMTADEIVVTATPDLAAFRNTKNLVDILSAARPNDSAPTLVINQFDNKLSPVQPDQFAEHVGIEPAQVFAYEPQLFGAAATNASPITEVGPKSKTAQSLRELAAQVIGKSDASIIKPKFSLAGLFKKKR